MIAYETLLGVFVDSVVMCFGVSLTEEGFIAQLAFDIRILAVAFFVRFHVVQPGILVAAFPLTDTANVTADVVLRAHVVFVFSIRNEAFSAQIALHHELLQMPAAMDLPGASGFEFFRAEITLEPSGIGMYAKMTGDFAFPFELFTADFARVSFFGEMEFEVLLVTTTVLRGFSAYLTCQVPLLRFSRAKK